MVLGVSFGRWPLSRDGVFILSNAEVGMSTSVGAARRHESKTETVTRRSSRTLSEPINVQSLGAVAAAELRSGVRPVHGLYINSRSSPTGGDRALRRDPVGARGLAELAEIAPFWRALAGEEAGMMEA